MLDALKSPEHWTRYQAKRELTVRDRAEVSRVLDRWVRSLDPKDPRHEHHLYEALGTCATLELVKPGLLRRLLEAKEPRARAFAARVAGRWHDRLERPLDLLAGRVVDGHPLVRMEAVMACAAIPSAASIAMAARVIDKPKDDWIEYAFKQAVHHLRPDWMPAFQQGRVAFASPGQLAAVLNETGGREALASLKRLLETEDLGRSARAAAISAILAVGEPGDLQAYGLESARFTAAGRYDAAGHAEALARLVEVARLRDVRPAGDLAASLSPLLQAGHPRLQAGALELAGIWRVDKIQELVLAAATDMSLPVPVRAAAFGALVDMKRPGLGKFLADHAGRSNPPAVRSAAIRSLAAVDTRAAAEQSADLFAGSDLKPDDATATLSALLNRTGGAESLATALGARKLKPASARKLLGTLFSTGRSDQVLLATLSRAIGKSGRAPDYSADLVKRLVADSRQAGEPRRGVVLFKSLACVSCHRVGGTGGVIGPDLTAIGTTLSAERITEELLWPNRQVKEGFSMVQVVTEDGKIHQGYERKTRQSQATGDVVIQDPATGKLITIKKQQIELKKTTGSVMPTGLTAVLLRGQLLDLISYLSELGRIK